MASGDVGRFDDADRLCVPGRDDEMIVSGGEYVFRRKSQSATKPKRRSQAGTKSATRSEGDEE